MKPLKLILTENLYDPYTRLQEALYESLLKSYSPYKLINALEKKFGDHVVSYIRPRPSEYDKLCVAAFICSPKNEEILKNNQDFQSILNLYNYTFSYSYNIQRNGHIMKLCVLEPNITGDYTNIVYDEWNGIVYHITLRKNLEGILEKGLRAKDGIYRKFDSRIFVTGGDDFKENIFHLIEDLKYKNEDYVVLKIDLNKNPRKIKLFRDPVQRSCLGLYTRENIDKQCIKIYDFEDA